MSHPTTRRTILAATATFAVGGPIASSAQAQDATPGSTLAGTPQTANLETNRQLVAEAADAFFNQHDASAVDRYVSPNYVQHSTLVGDGRDALRDLVMGLGGGVSYEAVRLIADGDLVAAHGIYTGFGEVPLVAFDIFRVQDGLLAEHWDGLTAQTPPNPSGHTQTDGPTEITNSDETNANRTVAEGFVDIILIGGEADRITEFVSAEAYTQHNSQIADGLNGLGTALASLADQGLELVYNARHRTVAEGEFVLIQSDGDFSGPVVYYDLFRVEEGLIVEHWDVIQPIPADTPHDNGQF
jgi:predicted SnoaL-like aldol condensation-catalyzing enzyme